MESYSVLFPPVKRHTNPTPTTTLEPSSKNGPADVAVAFSGASSSSDNCFKPPQPPLFVPPGHIAFRLLCHSSRVGGLIGKSGSIIKQIQQQTNSRIRVDDPTEGSDHQVISVVSSPTVATRIKLSEPDIKAKEINGDTIDGDGGGGEWFDVSAAQEGILRVFERVVEVAAEGDQAAVFSGVVSCRLLVYKNQGGVVIGKGGMVVEKIKKETGCRIMVLHSDDFSPGSFAPDEIVEIEGNILSVKKALVLVTRRLQEFPSLGKMRTLGIKPLETELVTSVERPVMQSIPSSSMHHDPSLGHKTPQQEVIFKMLCPSDRVGGIIGKGGSIIEAIKSKIGASIVIGPPMPDSDERLITISAKESMESQYSPAQNAAILVFKRSIEAGLENGLDLDLKGSPVLARLLVPSYQVGSLLGRGGARIADMRKATGTGLRFICGNQVPRCVQEKFQILQITGELANVQNAIFTVTSRLRDNLFAMLISNERRNYNTLRTKDGTYGRVNGSPAFRSHLSLDISGNLNLDEPLAQSMENLQISNDINRPTSPSLVGPQTVNEVYRGNIMGNGESLPLAKGVGSLSSESKSASVTNTTIEIVVPDTAIGSIYGENGSNLDRLRQISRAKVVVHEPRPGTNLSIVVISGTPDETQIAQSLIQAFLLTGSE